MSTKCVSFFKRESLLCLFFFVSCFLGYAQELSLQGTIKNSMGEPLIGVAVTSDNGGRVVLTDLDGNFWIEVAEGDMLQISYIGFVTQKIRVRNASPLNIILQDENEYAGNLYEMGYGQRRKKDVTGAVSEVRPDEQSYGWVTSVQDLLQGKAGGLTVTTDGGAPGTGAVMRIRGGASLYANSEPLVVVDGFPLDHYGISGLDNWLSMINPNDIESFTILRDPGSTAIYGGRSANGVIQITTKKGTKGAKPTASYHGNMSISTVSNRSKQDVMDANTYRGEIYSMYGGDHIAQSMLGNANTNWQDEIYQTAFSTDHHVSVSGGLDFMPYRVSLGYTSQEGVLETSNYKRFTLGFNLNPALFDDHLKFNIQGKFMNARTSYADQQAIKAALYMDPTQPVYAANGSDYWQWGVSGAPVNPVSLLHQTDEKGTARSFVGTFGMEYRFHFAPSLRFHATLGIDRSVGKSRFESESPMYTTATNPVVYRDTDSEKTHLLLNTYLQWDKTYKRNRLNIMAGYEWQRFQNEVGTDDRSNFSQRGIDGYDVAFMGRIHYTHRNKYLVSLDVRTGPQKTVDWIDNTYFGFGLGWKINEEVFLRNSQAVTELKLRASIGLVGQRDENPVNTLPVHTPGTSQGSYPVGDTYYTLLPPDFQPYYGTRTTGDWAWNTRREYTVTFNGGMDLGFMKNRIRASINYFLMYGSDLWGSLGQINWENRGRYNWYYSGYRGRSNDGDWDRMGFDANMDFRFIETTDFSWDLGLTYFCLFEDWAYGDYMYGSKVGAISIGNGEYIMTNSDGPSNSFSFNRYYGGEQATPLMTFGLNTTFRYKRFDLSTQWRSHLLNRTYNEVIADQTAKGWDNLWSNGYFTNRIQRTMYSYSSTYLSDQFVQKGSFTRCDYITLGYTLPDFGSVLSGGRVYATVQNPFLITSYEGGDPEVGYITDAGTGHRSPGIDSGMHYPRPISVVIGVTLNF